MDGETFGSSPSAVPSNDDRHMIQPDELKSSEPLFWSPGNALDIVSGGTGATRRHSRQDMR